MIVGIRATALSVKVLHQDLLLLLGSLLRPVFLRHGVLRVDDLHLVVLHLDGGRRLSVYIGSATTTTTDIAAACTSERNMPYLHE